MKRICVFCGSSIGTQPVYSELAKALGAELAQRGLGLVFGGGRIGLMGVLAQAALDGGGEVTGVIPQALVTKEIAFLELSDLRVVATMHERKALMEELSDGFIALPGGIGTLEEWFEILTWSQLGLHRKPVALLDDGQFYQPLLKLLDATVAEGFLKPVHRETLIIGTDPAKILDRFAAYVPPPLPRWLKIEEA